MPPLRRSSAAASTPLLSSSLVSSSDPEANGRHSNVTAPLSSRLTSIAASPHTVILYESSHRIVDTVQELASTLGGDRRVCICREMTKLHETIRHMDLREAGMRCGTHVQAAAFITTGVQKGEFTLVLEGLREFNERTGVSSESPAVAASVLRCIREMRKEGIDKEVIMRVMESSFAVGSIVQSPSS